MFHRNTVIASQNQEPVLIEGAFADLHQGPELVVRDPVPKPGFAEFAVAGDRVHRLRRISKSS